METSKSKKMITIEQKIEDCKKEISKLESSILWLKEEYKKAEYEFKNPNRHIHFGMFTQAGNKKCREFYDKIIDRINSPEPITENELLEMYHKEINIVKVNHPEVTDTDVREIMYVLIKDALKERGYSYEIGFYMF